MIVKSDLWWQSAALISRNKKKAILSSIILLYQFKGHSDRVVTSHYESTPTLHPTSPRSTWFVERFFPRPSPNVKSKILETKHSYLFKGNMHWAKFFAPSLEVLFP